MISEQDYGCPQCGTKTKVNFQEPRIRNLAKWTTHNKPDGTKCSNSGKRARVRHDWK